MHRDLDYLEPKVGQILRAPGTDLTTISAKRVRRQLLSLEPSLTAEYLKEHKAEIDQIIARVFEQVSAENAARNGEVTDEEEAESSDSASRKRPRGTKSDDEVGEEDGEEEEKSARPPTKKAKKSSGKNGQKLSDEELARKLSNEINGRTTRTSGKSSGGKGRSTKGKSRKSAATVNSDGESDSGGEKKPKKSKSTSGGGGGAKGGFKKEFMLR